MIRQPYDTATKATAERGEVMLDGPDGVATSLTPRAAHESAAAIEKAAIEATRQEAERD